MKIYVNDQTRITNIYITVDNSVEQMLISCKNKNMFSLILNYVDFEPIIYNPNEPWSLGYYINGEHLISDYLMKKSNTNISKDYVNVYVLD